MLGDLVFVGGAVTSLLVTDERAGLPRTTLDVSEDTSDGAPLYRWIRERSWTSFHWMRGFWDSLIAGIASRWKPQPKI
jgi:hypothetical protein